MLAKLEKRKEKNKRHKGEEERKESKEERLASYLTYFPSSSIAHYDLLQLPRS